MEHDCKFEDKVNEMHSDIKVLVSEFKNMNGELRVTKTKFDKHADESISFRDKVNIMWAVVHSLKWVVVVCLGSGVIWRFLK